MAADLERTAASACQGVQAALHDVDRRLHAVNKSISDYNLPAYPDYDPAEFHNRALRQAMDFDPAKAAALAENIVPCPSDEQRAALDAIMLAVRLEWTVKEFF